MGISLECGPELENSQSGHGDRQIKLSLFSGVGGSFSMELSALAFTRDGEFIYNPKKKGGKSTFSHPTTCQKIKQQAGAASPGVNN